ncbi:MAG TPA: O-GlcNAc transferase, partial [Phycisphaerae bacterium]|nr:O-GlcNAc transferase [Phycisphaerae bacterium]
MRRSAQISDSIQNDRPRQIRNWVWGLVIAISTFAAYGPALFGDFIWDDDSYVSENKAVTSPGFSGLTSIWTDYTATPQYYPLVFTSYWIEYRLWGLHTPGYHITNIALHVFSAILLGRLLTRLRVPGAWLAAAVFALHPVNVESVAWITERKNALCGLFYILSLSAYVRFAALDTGEFPPNPRVGTYLLCMLCFIGALLSKTVTASLPAVILLLIWWRRGRVSRMEAATLVPMFVVGAALGLFTAWLEKHHVGAVGHEWKLTLLDRFLIATRAPWFYASKIVWPWSLAFIYDRWQIDSRQAWQYLFPIATILTLGVLWLARRRIGRGPLLIALCLIGTLFPALGFFN